MRCTRPDAVGLDHPLRARLRRTRRARHGAAMVEAVIMLPVLGLLLVGTLFMRERYLAKQQVQLQARQCAWQYAMDGCTGDPPAGCGAGSRLDRDVEAEEEGSKMMSSAHTQGGGGDFNVFDKVPLLGDALHALFGTKTSFESTIDVRVPWQKDMAYQANGKFVVMCNTKPRKAPAVAKDVLCAFLPGKHCK